MNSILELHNQSAGKIVADIVRPTLEAGGETTDVMVLLESVLVGVSLAVIKLGGDDRVLDVVVERARERLTELRLKDIEAQGNG
jgi:hypothetical protein